MNGDRCRSADGPKNTTHLAIQEAAGRQRTPDYALVLINAALVSDDVEEAIAQLRTALAILAAANVAPASPIIGRGVAILAQTYAHDDRGIEGAGVLLEHFRRVDVHPSASLPILADAVEEVLSRAPPPPLGAALAEQYLRLGRLQPGSSLEARACAARGQCAAATDEEDLAVAMLGKALDILAQGPDADPMEVKSLFDQIGRCLVALGHLEEAIPPLERCLALERAHLGETNTDVAISHDYLGRIHHDLERFEDAMRHHEFALAIFTAHGDFESSLEQLLALAEASAFHEDWVTVRDLCDRAEAIIAERDVDPLLPVPLGILRLCVYGLVENGRTGDALDLLDRARNGLADAGRTEDWLERLARDLEDFAAGADGT